MKLYYRHFGQGTPLIVIHGLFGSSDNWLTVCKSFTSQHSVYLLDMRNHGQSPHSTEHNYALMAADVYEFVHEHNLKNVILLGHSMGGKVVMKYLEKYSANVLKAVIVDISPRYYAPHHSREIEALLSIPLHNIGSRQEADDIMARKIPEIGVRQFLLKGLYRNDSGLFAWRFNLNTIINEINNIGEATTYDTKCQTDTLFVRGENSKYIQPHDLETINDNFAHYLVVTIPLSGHWVQADQPILFTEAVNKFISNNI
ncbi:MAG: alpha/beta fold hydrolase [Cytophagales bacterium]|nr:alpha/beta fold hydrolase [Cytophagales bacterium]